MTKTPKRQALGKGLGALIPGGNEEAEQGTLLHVNVEEVFPNPKQPRRSFSNGAMEELAVSIKEKGILQPIIVQRVPGGYELVAGERRLRASRLAGLTKIPVLVKQVKGDEKLELALIENIQRENLNPVEEAQAYRDLQKSQGYTQENLAEKIGKDRATVSNSLRLLTLPGFVKEELVKGTLSAGHGRALLQVKDEGMIRKLLGRILATGMSVREAEKAAARSKGKPSTISARISSPDTRALEKRLERYLGCNVRIQEGQRTGRLEVRYRGLDQLNNIVDKILK
jgi:ParB family chromosome partitioning protein